MLLDDKRSNGRKSIRALAEFEFARRRCSLDRARQGGGGVVISSSIPRKRGQPKEILGTAGTNLDGSPRLAELQDPGVQRRIARLAVHRRHTTAVFKPPPERSRRDTCSPASGR